MRSRRQDDPINPPIKPEFSLAALLRCDHGGRYGADWAKIARAVEHQGVHSAVVAFGLCSGKPLPVALPRC